MMSFTPHAVIYIYNFVAVHHVQRLLLLCNAIAIRSNDDDERYITYRWLYKERNIYEPKHFAIHQSRINWFFSVVRRVLYSICCIWIKWTTENNIKCNYNLQGLVSGARRVNNPRIKAKRRLTLKICKTYVRAKGL